MVGLRARITVFVLIGVGLISGLLVGRQLMLYGKQPHPDDKPSKLNILTYQSFMGSHGPGEEILKQFERTCDCKANVMTLADSGLLLERLKLAQEKAPFDIVLGLDLLVLPRAQKDFAWTVIDEPPQTGWLSDAVELTQRDFAVVDWSPLTFLYREDGQPIPTTFNELADPKFKTQFTIEDPHASAPGLQFWQWTQALKKDVAWLQEFRNNVREVAPTWAFAYGLFEKKQTRFVFTYLSSLSFHWGQSQDRTYKVLAFPEGHPRAVEYAAIPQSAPSPELAQKFIRALHSEWAQALIMRKNYMFPVLANLISGSIYAELPKLKTIATPTPKDLSEWDQVFAH